MINKLIKETLSSLGVQVSFQKYSGKENTYITFFEYLQQGESYADNKETCTGHYVQVDVWSKEDYTDLVNSILVTMTQAGFRRTTQTEIYEDDTQAYHKVLRFFYEEEVS
ncbi:MAG: hypothetical protein AB9888_08110 [Bacteroidales bacterium]